jgi:Protein of unknown function, DUF547
MRSTRSLSRFRRPLVMVVLLEACGTVRAPAQSLPTHDLLDSVLTGHIHDGLVDYTGLRAHRRDLDRYLDELSQTDPAALERAPREDRLAFWINAYNACVLRLIIDHYPIIGPHRSSGVERLTGPDNSIRQIPGTWTTQFCRVARRDRSLDGIESGILRPMGDPRIHFALSCAARGCSGLADAAYRGDRLDEQLDEAVKRFVADPHQFQVGRGEPPVLRVNKFLDWYKEDFGGTAGLVAFLRRYVPAGDAERLRPGGVRVEYLDFDWSLNDATLTDSVR